MRNQIKDEILKSKVRYGNDIAEKSQTSPKEFLSFIKKKTECQNWSELSPR